MSLLERQRAVLNKAGLKDITVVAGYRADQIERRGFATRLNHRFASTNMVASLFCAEDLFDGSSDVIVSYGDIVFEPRVIGALLRSEEDFTVAVDKGWHAYWSLRQEDPLQDAETMKIRDGYIMELGRKPRSLADIEAQYMGLFRIRAKLLPMLRDFYHSLPRREIYDGKDFDNMFMTTLLQQLIDSGWKLAPALVNNGWLEVDSVSDLELYEKMAAAGTLKPFCDLSVVQ